MIRSSVRALMVVAGVVACLMLPPAAVAATITSTTNPTDSWQLGWGNTLLPAFTVTGGDAGALYRLDRTPTTVISTATPGAYLFAPAAGTSIPITADVLLSYTTQPGSGVLGATFPYEGEWWLHVNPGSRDGSFESTTTHAPVRIDLTAPTKVSGVTVALVPGSSRRYRVRWTDADYDLYSTTGLGSGVAYYRVYLDDALVSSPPGLLPSAPATNSPGVPWSSWVVPSSLPEFDLENLDPGSYTVRVSAVDRALNEGALSDPVPLVVLPTGPTIILTNPLVNGMTYGLPLVIRAYAEGQPRIARVTFAIDGRIVSTVLPRTGETSVVAASAIVTSLDSRASHLLVATVTDSLGRSTSVSRTFTYSPTLRPSPLDLYPAKMPDSKIEGSSETNPYVSDDTKTFWRELWGNSLKPQFTLQSPDFMNFENIPADVLYLIDRSPHAQIAPSDPGSYYRSVRVAGPTLKGVFDVQGLTESDGSLSGVTQIPGRVVDPVEGIWYWHFYIDKHDGSVKPIHDMAFGVDVTAPSQVTSVRAYRSISATMPLSDWLSQNRIHLRWDNSERDLLSGTAYFRVYLDEQVHIPSSGDLIDPFGSDGDVPWYVNNRPTESLTLEDLPSGRHTLSVSAVDRAGNEGPRSAPVTVLLDSDTPSITVTAPSVDQVVNPRPTFTVDATDAAGIAYVTYFIDGVRIGRSSRAPYSLSPDLSRIPNGRHTLTAVATDMFGATGQTANVPHERSSSVSFILDKTPPSLSSMSIAPNPIFPRPDGFRDAARISFRGSGYTTVTLEVAKPGPRPAAGAPLAASRRWYARSSGPRTSFTYDGSSSGGATALPLNAVSATRTYWVRLVLRDAVGNVRRSTWQPLTAKTAPQLVRLGPDTVQVIQR